jgi:hypothetical protein
MTHENFIRGALMFLAALALTFAVLALNPASAGETDKDQAIEKALVERTRSFCKAVLPVWFASKHGLADAKVRMAVADCYTGHARLGILGMESELTLTDAALSEVPAKLLRERTGMNLEIYYPLTGRTIRVRASKN